MLVKRSEKMINTYIFQYRGYEIVQTVYIPASPRFANTISHAIRRNGADLRMPQNMLDAVRWIDRAVRTEEG
jgi:hypothetical protein